MTHPPTRSRRDDILLRVQKPARYIGGEWNQVTKDLQRVTCRVALAFPDVYEIGMSYHGYQLLYQALNRMLDVYAERVYSPWMDFEALLREYGYPLESLETGTPLREFDWVGITLQHELSYTNVLNLLALGGIPLERTARSAEHPWVVAGGPCASNPEPLAEVFDLVVVGDGEAVWPELIRAAQAMKEVPREVQIQRLSALPGVYAPGRYHPIYSPGGELLAIEAEPGAAYPVQRRIEPVPDELPQPLVPHVGITHDRLTGELFRGCVRGCRFCQAGMINRPLRERNPQSVLEQFLNSLKQTGYEEMSWTSLSTGDYTQVLPLVQRLMPELANQRVALSFPSLRLDSFQAELAQKVQQVRKTGLTFAPEAGSERLQRVINKRLDEEGFTRSLSEIFSAGWELIKLYFMIGLPTETQADVDAIAGMIRRILQAARAASTGRRMPRLHLSVNLFVPKPHTPFQWSGQLPQAQAAERLRRLADQLPRSVEYFFGPRTARELDKAYLEAVLARGDRRLWPVVRRAWELGASFDSWGDHFRYDLWQQAFAEQGVDPAGYALRERKVGECLPWSHLHMGVEPAYLEQEWNRAQAGELTDDCRQAGACHACGIQKRQSCPLPLAQPLAQDPRPVPAVSRPEREVTRIRVRYQKTGDMRFVGHLDIVNVFRRAARRAELPLHYSVSFHPQPSLAFGPPLPLGATGLSEWLDIGLDRWMDPQQLVESMNRALPNGLQLTAAREVPLNTSALAEQINAGEYMLRFPDEEDYAMTVRNRIEALRSPEPVKVSQWSKRGTVEVDLGAAVVAVDLVTADEGNGLQVKVLHRTLAQATAKLATVVEFLCGGRIPVWRVHVTRLASGTWQENHLRIP